MRVGSNDNQKKTQDQVQQPQGAQPQQGYQQQQYNDDPFAGLGVATLSGGVDTEGFAAFSEEMKRLAALPEIANMLKVEAIPVSSQQLYLPVLALAAPTGDGEVVVFNLLIEGMMSQKLEPIVDQIRDMGGQREIIMDRPTSRAFDNTLRDVVAKGVAAHYKVAQDKVFHIAHTVVPTAADLSSAETTRVFFDTAHLALMDIVGGKGIGRVTAKNLVHPTVEVRQRTMVTPGEVRLNKIGQLIAADFNTTLKLSRIQPKQQDAYQVHTGTQEYNLAEVSGYLDFNILAQQQQSPYAVMQPNQQPKPGYMPVVVLTEVSGLANSGRSIEDLRTQLLGLVATLPMTANHGWVRVFEQFPGEKSKKSSLGLLGLEYDPYGRGPEALGKVPVESVTFGKMPEEGKETPFTMALKWCTQQVSVALDIEQGGRLEWAQSAFAAAAANKPGANETIIKECDALTGGLFSTLWAQVNGGNGATPVVRPETVAVHLGTYTGADGKPRDLRTVDYLTMLAASPKDLQFVANATAAMTPGVSNNVTLSDRRRALMSVTGGCEITGMATRVYFHANFIQCLIQALVDNGVKIRSDDLMNYDQGIQRAGIDASFGAQFNAGAMYQPTYGQMGAPGEPVMGGYYNPGYYRR